MSTTSAHRITVLFTGYCYVDKKDPSQLRANCSCVLVQFSSGENLIVDTMTAWDGKRLELALANHGLKPTDIHFVVCTHGHADHIGCNQLFTAAKWHIVGQNISNKDAFLIWDFEKQPFKLDKSGDALVKATPGHTLTCVSVIVANSEWGGVVGLCGDLFERMEDIEDESLWQEAGSESIEKQKESRLAMARICTCIVPGHGPKFNVTEAMRRKLREDRECGNCN